MKDKKRIKMGTAGSSTFIRIGTGESTESRSEKKRNLEGSRKRSKEGEIKHREEFRQGRGMY